MQALGWAVQAPPAEKRGRGPAEHLSSKTKKHSLDLLQ